MTARASLVPPVGSTRCAESGGRDYGFDNPLTGPFIGPRPEVETYFDPAVPLTRSLVMWCADHVMFVTHYQAGSRTAMEVIGLGACVRVT
jgi:hypothetical protein